MPIADLETLEYKLTKRGFRQADLYHHECPSCHEPAVRVYGIGGKLGGRDIRLCLACGAVKSRASDSRSRAEPMIFARFAATTPHYANSKPAS